MKRQPLILAAMALGVVLPGAVPAWSQSGTAIRINAGGIQYRDPRGQLWAADSNFAGGVGVYYFLSVSNTDSAALYQDARVGMAVTYRLSVPDGGYRVTLKLAEPSVRSAGQRLFNVLLNGTVAAPNVDIFQLAGGRGVAYDLSRNVVVSGGTLTVQLQSVTGQAVLNGLEIVPLVAPAPPVAPASVKVTMSPASVSLTAGQTAQFAAAVTGTTNSGVVWSVAPAVGTISASGLYQAPASVSTAQTLTVTAASVADRTKSATAVVSLAPPADRTPPTVTFLSPANGTTASGTVVASVNATDNVRVKSVQFLLNGALLGAALTAPPYSYSWNTQLNGAGQQRLKAVATDDAGNNGESEVYVTVTNPSVSKVKLPVEVMGPGGTTASVTVSLPSTVDASGAFRLWMQVHAMNYQDKVSIQVNQGAWISLNDSTVTLPARERAYGGIGGGYGTLRATVRLPLGVVQPGSNTIRFRFNYTDGNASGFRILAFNFLDANGNRVIPESSFEQEDPATWQPPLVSSADIAEGKRLWDSAPLSAPGLPSIRARCGDCHARDGRDLKYFNYSNLSIKERSVFHGLTSRQGDQIASYIRTLNVPAPAQARPWNPPYQPGPGRDSLPVSEWAAGAGLGAVLEHDNDLIPHLNNAAAAGQWASSAYLNAREIPIAYQLLDWNRWLPTVHPLDMWGDAFLNSETMAYYRALRSELRLNDPVAYRGSFDRLKLWFVRNGEFLGPRKPPAEDPRWKTRFFAEAMYSEPLWILVKNWELHQEFGLEGMAKAIHGATAPSSRAWSTQFPFFTSPLVMGIPRDAPVANGKRVTHAYLSFAWYQTQLVLNDGNGTAYGTSPIDWPYAYGVVANDLAWDGSAVIANTGGLLTLWTVKGLQAFDRYNSPAAGWQMFAAEPGALTGFPTQITAWTGMPAGDKRLMMERYLRAWLAKISSMGTLAIQTSGYASANLSASNWDAEYTKRMMYWLPRYRYEGVSQTVLDDVKRWAQTVWPSIDWNAVVSRPCRVGNQGEIFCP